MFKPNSSFNTTQELSSILILDAFWLSTLLERSITVNLSAYQVQTTGSSIFIEFETTGNIKTKSCEYPIVKTPTPTFSISPVNVSIPCGDTSSRTFTISSANIPSGATLSYNWSHIGWSIISSTATSRTLQPNLATVLPQNVTVTPILNSVAKPSISSFVSRSEFNPNYNIIGNTNLCPGNTTPFSINVGTNSVVWSVSNASIASLNTTTGNDVSLTGISEGVITLNALVTNSCGQSTNFQKTIGIGLLLVQNNTVFGTPLAFTLGEHPYSVYEVPGASSYLWSVSTVSTTCNQGTGIPTVITSNGNTATFNWTNCPGLYKVTCFAVNNCGGPNEKIGDLIVNVVQRPPSGGGSGGGCSPPTLEVNPNPIARGGSISLRLAPPPNPCRTASTNLRVSTNNEAKIYDLQGNLRYSNTFTGNTFQINNVNLTRGHYVLNVFTGEGEVTRKVIIMK